MQDVEELRRTFQLRIVSECVGLIKAAGSPNPMEFAHAITTMFIDTFAALIAGVEEGKREEFFQNGIVAISKDIKEQLKKVNINLNVIFLN